jgi:hypothetical protein
MTQRGELVLVYLHRDLLLGGLILWGMNEDSMVSPC